MFGVTSTSTVSEPRTAATTTTNFSRFLDCTAFVAYGADEHRRRDCCYLCVNIGQRKQKDTLTGHGLAMHLHATGLELTLARFHAFRPAVINIVAANSSTVPEPSTARSATTDSAGFLECSTIWTRFHMSDC